MRPQQAGFDFNTFEAFGWTATPIEDYTAAQRERAARMEREHRERQRATKERHEREQREREEQARRRSARSTAYESPWSVLGVTPGCSGAEIRSAWKRACKQHHPDIGGDVEQMKRANKAYSDLKGQMR